MTSATAENATLSDPEQGRYVPVAIDTLIPSTELPFDLFLRTEPGGSPVLYRERRLAVDQEDLARLIGQAIQTLYIRVSEHVAYRNYLRKTVLSNTDLPATRRFRILQIANREILRLAFQNHRADMLVNVAGEYGRELATVICDENVVLTDLLPLMTHDYQTYTHATNVCTLALIIATSMGLGFHDGIVEMSVAMLLHDLGKRRISSAILNQHRALTVEQRDMCREHAKWGFLEICHRPDVTRDQLMVVYQHHEQWDGRGYPVGLVGEEIHFWARICAVADVYDQMSSGRANQPARTQDDVWGALEQGCGRRFDADIVRCLRSVVGPSR